VGGHYRLWLDVRLDGLVNVQMRHFECAFNVLVDVHVQVPPLLLLAAGAMGGMAAAKYLSRR